MQEIVCVVTPYTMVFAPGVLVAAHVMSSRWVGVWDKFRLVHFFQDSIWAHFKWSEMLRGVPVSVAISLGLSFEGSSIFVWGDLVVLALIT